MRALRSIISIVLATVLTACAEPSRPRPAESAATVTQPALLTPPASPGPPRWRWSRPEVTFDSGTKATIGESRRTGLRVEAALNGVSGRFMVDTGASRTVIATAFADRAKLQLLPEGTFETSSDAILTRGRWCDELRLGPMTVKGIRFAEIRDDSLRDVLGGGFDGMIGVEVLRLMIAEFDLDRGTLTIRDPDRAVEGVRAGDWSSVEMATGRPCVRCRFEGDRDGLFLLDTGSDGGVQFFSRAVTDLKLLDGRRTSERTIRSVHGSGKAARGTLEWITIADKHIENVQADFFTEEVRSSRLTGQIGRRALQGYTLVLDLSERRMALVERGGM